MTLKGQYIEKIQWGTLNWLRKNIFQLLFVNNLFLTKLFSAYKENTPNGEKSIKITHIFVYNGTT
jgi:hypothetical protein